MSKWWAKRLLWLSLGLLTGVITLLPESAAVASGIIALIFIGAMFVLLGRWAAMTISGHVTSAAEKRDPDKVTLAAHEFFPGASLEFEASRPAAKQAPAAESETELSRFGGAGFRFRTLLNIEEEKLDPRKKALLWDSVLFGGAMVLCAWLASLVK